MASTADHGMFNPKMVDASSHKLTNQRMNAGVPPMKDLKNQPNDDAMRAIRSMKAPQGGVWKSNAESALRQSVK